MTITKLPLVALAALAVAVPALADDQAAGPTPTAHQQCAAEKAQMGAAAFNQAYGTNKNHRNAFGRCVSKRSQATEAALEREPHAAASHLALSRHAHAAARKRTASERSTSARKAARTRKRSA
jgi:hypothetical protein